ncbi:MAG: SAM-dependent methyltransferase [Nocardia sp.]|nr:SAM-dependent methyltransferase [Nocardia sp.]
MTDSVPEVDQTQPSIARVYDYLLGGQDNYAVDRAVGDFFVNDLPGSVAIARDNREALVRTIEAITESGVGQFIDIGSGLPTNDNVHQVAQRHLDAPRVAYVDNDPIVLAHGRALLSSDENTTVIRADMRTPEDILANTDFQRLIDLDKPVAVIFSAVLHHLNDDENPGELVKFWSERIAPGSLVYISHFRTGFNEETEAAEAKLQESFGRGRWRSDEEIEALFGDLEVLDPGIEICLRWLADSGEAASVDHIGAREVQPTVWQQLIASALARKN